MVVQGVFSTFYGPHGMEALHITYGLMDPPLSALLPHGKCFAGLKVRPWAFFTLCCTSEAYAPVCSLP